MGACLGISVNHADHGPEHAAFCGKSLLQGREIHCGGDRHFCDFFYTCFLELMGKWKTLLLLNPVAPILEGLNDCIVLRQMPELNWIAYSGLFSLGLIVFSYTFFKRLEPAFAESI